MSAIKKVADNLQLSPRLLMAFVTVESSFDPKATRYEKNFKYIYQVPKYAKKLGLSVAEELENQKTSFGLLQIMGANAREHGFEGKFSDLLEPAIGLQYGALYLKQLMNKYTDLSDAIAAYNAGSPRKLNGYYVNQNYVDNVLGAYNNAST